MRITDFVAGRNLLSVITYNRVASGRQRKQTNLWGLLINPFGIQCPFENQIRVDFEILKLSDAGHHVLWQVLVFQKPHNFVTSDYLNAIIKINFLQVATLQDWEGTLI